MDSDRELLRKFSEERNERAFSLLVDRYLGLIFHTALRRTDSRELAEEVSQNVLCVLARKSGELVGKSELLPAWLHKAAVYESSKAMRSERSYLKKKRALIGPHEGADAPHKEWNEVIPRLDAALERLGKEEKRILLLHYFENHTFREIAGLVGKTPAAVQRQAHRTVEKLGTFLGNRRTVLPITVVAAGLSAEFSKAAPVGLGGRLTGNALSQASIASSSNLLTVIMSSKAKSWLPLSLLSILCPVAVVGAAIRYEDNRKMDARIAGLEAKMVARQGMAATGRRIPEGGTQVASSKETIDWSALAEEAKLADRNASGSRSDLVMLRELRLMAALDSSGIDAEIRKIDTLDADDGIKRKLKSMLLMGSKIRTEDPRKAVELFFPATDDRNRIDIELSAAWVEWLKEDFDSARAWFDARLAEGAFHSKRLDGRSARQRIFEGALIGELIKQSPSLARDRIGQLPETARAEVFLDPMFPLNERTLPHLPAMIREMLPESGQSTVVAYTGARLAQMNPELLTRFLNEVAATPSERRDAALDGVVTKVRSMTQRRKFQRDDLAVIRAWAETVAPGSEDRIVGRALVNTTDFVNHKLSFDDAVSLLREYGATDDALLGFVEAQLARNYGRASVKLAEEIQDVDKREQALKRFR